MKVTQIKGSALVVIGMLGLLGATQGSDGARIVNSGSTNTAPWSIAVRSDGTGSYSIEQRRYAGSPTVPPSQAIAVPRPLVQRFLSDAKAARIEGAKGEPCMKSASFGSTTVVMYHGWVSPDLLCPSSSGTLAALARDVSAIRSAANLDSMPRPVRIPPNELRRPNPLVSP